MVLNRLEGGRSFFYRNMVLGKTTVWMKTWFRRSCGTQTWSSKANQTRPEGDFNNIKQLPAQAHTCLAVERARRSRYFRREVKENVPCYFCPYKGPLRVLNSLVFGANPLIEYVQPIDPDGPLVWTTGWSRTKPTSARLGLTRKNSTCLS